MRSVLIIFSLACCLGLAGLAQAGPFGTEMGQKPEQFTGLEKIEFKGPRAEIHSLYRAHTLPKMNPIFDRYILLFGRTGLARVLAYSKPYMNDSFGNQLQENFNTLKRQLTKKYGKPEEFDFLKDGSLWNKSRDFVMGIHKNERVLAASWENNLPDNLDAIMLKAEADSPTNSSLVLIYEYKNFKDMVEEIEKAAEDAL